MPSANSRADPGILKTSQWRTSSVFLCTATSGSCMISAKVIVFAGTLVHCRRGETGFGSDCVNLAGISPPSANAVVVRVNPGPGGAFFAASWAIAETRMIEKHHIQMRISSSSLLSLVQNIRAECECAGGVHESGCDSGRVQLYREATGTRRPRAPGLARCFWNVRSSKNTYCPTRGALWRSGASVIAGYDGTETLVTRLRSLSRT